MNISIISILKKLRIFLLIKIKYRRKVFVGKNLSFGRRTHFYAQNRIDIGDHVYFGRDCSIEADAEIGDYCLIANNVAFIGRNDHDFRVVGIPVRFAPSVRSSEVSQNQPRKVTRIERDVWIGYGSIILSGVTVGEGAIIGAGSLVTTDIPPYSIAFGWPANVRGLRFNDTERQAHAAALKRQRFGP